MRKLPALLVVTAFSAALVFALHSQMPSHEESGYWVWRGSDLELVDSSAPLLLYQGDYQSNHNPPFIKRGVGPFSPPGRTEVGLLIRMYDIGDAELFVDQATYLIEQWQARDIKVDEIQLDYDCPSSRLAEYSHFINQARSLLVSRGIEIPLSITGLLTWRTDDATALDQLAESVSYIAFQLYDTHEPLPNLDALLVSFNHYEHAYKIGISTSANFDRLEYPRNDNYQGHLVFLNVPH